MSTSGRSASRERGRHRLEEPELRGDVAVGHVVTDGLGVDQVGEHQTERRGSDARSTGSACSTTWRRISTTGW